MNKKIVKIILWNTLLIIVCTILPLQRLEFKYYNLILQGIFIIYTISLLFILHIILTSKMKDKPVVKKHYKSLFFGFSILVVFLSGTFHILYTKAFVAPQILYCDYYDDYHYKLYSSKSGCPKFTHIETTYKNNELTYLKYELNGNSYERFYENEKIIKEVDQIYDKEYFIVEANDKIPFIHDYKLIETNYIYDKDLLSQKRIITYYANNLAILKQTGDYEAKKKGNEESYIIDINKNINKYEFILTKQDLLTKVYTKDYLNIKQSSNEYVSNLFNYYESQPSNNYTTDFYGDKRSTEYMIDGRYHLSSHLIPYTYFYVNKDIDAWKSYDTRYFIYDNFNQFGNVYLDYKKGYRVNYLQNGINCTLNDDQEIKYCDSIHLNKPVYRHLVDNKNSITTVKTYSLLNIIKRNEYPKTNYIAQYDELPFGESICRTELFDTPKYYFIFTE